MKPTAVIMALLILGVLAETPGITKSYDIVPYKGCVAQTGPAPYNVVTQFYRNTLDSLWKVSVWIGDTFGGGTYKVEVKDSATDALVASKANKQASQMWSWLDFDLDPGPVQPVRGRTYKVVVTRPTGGAISFAYCDTNPYRYGCLSVGGTAQPDWDLALRVVGLMRVFRGHNT